MLQKIRAYCQICAVEINGFGIVERRGNDLLITDAFITRQVAKDESVVADGEGILRACAERGIKADQLRCQWHSHVNAPAVFSEQDIRQINTWSGGYMVSIVANKRGDARCRIDCYEPLRLAIEVPLELAFETTESLLRACRSEVSEQVIIMRTQKKNGGRHD